MDVESLVKVFKWTMYAMLAVGIIVAAGLLALIYTILSWSS